MCSGFAAYVLGRARPPASRDCNLGGRNRGRCRAGFRFLFLSAFPLLAGDVAGALARHPTRHIVGMRASYVHTLKMIRGGSPALVLALPVAIIAYLAWKRTRYFGNTAPLLIAAMLFILAVGSPDFPGQGFHLALLPFLFVFIAGIFAGSDRDSPWFASDGGTVRVAGRGRALESGPVGPFEVNSCLAFAQIPRVRIRIAEFFQHSTMSTPTQVPPSKFVYVTRTGLPVTFKFDWPFRRATSGADFDVLHSEIILENSENLRALVAVNLSATLREVLPSLDPKDTEGLLINALRKEIDNKQIEFVKSGKLVPLHFSSRHYDFKRKHWIFGKATDEEIARLIERKVYWQTRLVGGDVWLGDATEAYYVPNHHRPPRGDRGLFERGKSSADPTSPLRHCGSRADGSKQQVRTRDVRSAAATGTERLPSKEGEPSCSYPRARNAHAGSSFEWQRPRPRSCASPEHAFLRAAGQRQSAPGSRDSRTRPGRRR